jgi:S1-C subfamily serine protease
LSGTILLASISLKETAMPDVVTNPLLNLSEALVERAGFAKPLVARIAAQGHRPRSGMLWRKNVIIASEQAFPEVGEATVTLADGGTFPAQVAGRDPGTNVIALRFDGAPDPMPSPAGEPRAGALALVLGADDAGVSVRLGIIHSVGPSWHSRAGGRIDRRISLDMTLTAREEGGPVLDAAGGVLGMSTLGPRGRVLVIPSSTVDGVIEPLLSRGRVERGWLGVSLQPVLVPEGLQSEAGGSRGLMIMGVSKNGPAAQANLHVGDILVAIGGQNVTSPAMVAQRLGPDSVGHQIELRLIRAGNLLSLPVTVAARPSQ